MFIKQGLFYSNVCTHKLIVSNRFPPIFSHLKYHCNIGMVLVIASVSHEFEYSQIMNEILASVIFEYVGEGAVYWSESAVCNEYSVTGGLMC